MTLRKSLLSLAILGGLHAGIAQASYDMICSPDWTVISDQLSGCSNLPFLSPGNDSRVNLQLLLADKGRVTLPKNLDTNTDYTEGYAQVPFAVDMLHPAIADVDEEDSSTSAEEQDDLRQENLSLSLEQMGVELGADALAAQRFADGEGNRCRSNNLDNAQSFVTQLEGDSALSQGERRALATSRINLLSLCGEGAPQQQSVLPAAADVASPAAQAFAKYLAGADAFYRGDFAGAHEYFASLATSDQPWLKETALYMQARVALNQAQQNTFDDYGIPDLEKVDRISLDASAAGFKAYLQAYPDGLYFASARGLLRKVYWLQNDNAKFIDEFAWQFAQADDGKRNVSTQELIEELDLKLQPNLKPESVEDPLLLAMVDLTYLRKPYGDKPAKITLEQLQAQKGRFAAEPGLHEYLIAAWHFYREGDADKTLAALPAAGKGSPLSFLQFSQETLRGLALEAKGDLGAAQQHWLQLFGRSSNPLQRAQLELALAMNYERDGKLDKVFAADSLIETPQIREILLRNTAGPDLLRQQAGNTSALQNERTTALYTLLYKELVYGEYNAFLSDLKRMPQPVPDAQQGSSMSLAKFTWQGEKSGYACPSLTEVAERLAKSNDDAQAANCLGDFIRINDLDGNELNSQPSANLLGGSPTLFKGSPFSRLAAYIKIIDDPQAAEGEKSYALYRAINCYAPSGYNGCDGQDIDKNQRKQWFQTLKTRYGKTQWAQGLKYYW